MKKIFLLIINVALLCVIFITVFYLINQKNEILAQGNFWKINKPFDITIQEKVKIIKREKPLEREIRGVYLTSNTAGLNKSMDNLIAAIKKSSINAFVIDIKDYSGKIAYDSQIELVNQLQTDKNVIKNLPELINKLHQQGIYVIARQTVFQDPELTDKRPDLAVQNSQTGKPWLDYKGLAWADPTNQEVWQYNLAIAKEAINLGFDEINFDYIRFPSDGPMSQMQFKNLANHTKAETMKNFFEFLHDNLKEEPAYISGDLFGFTTERDDDMNIGQQIEDAILYFDYVCPMVYPSHYPSGHLNFKNPAEHPFEVVSQAIKKGIESINKVPDKRGKIRPWLQAFNLGAKYTSTMIDLQIKAAAENGGYGYLLWNARNVYNYLP
jgi:hypothetical protein